MNTRHWQMIEGALVFALALGAAMWMGAMPWWLLALLLFAPDVSMVGYVAGPRLGAALYNAVHIYAFGGAVAIAAVLAGSAFWACAGLLFIAHAGLDRALGFGLKELSDFKDTHLGRIGG